MDQILLCIVNINASFSVSAMSLKHSQMDGSAQYSKPGQMEQQQINN